MPACRTALTRWVHLTGHDVDAAVPQGEASGVLTVWQVPFRGVPSSKVHPSGVHALLGRWFGEGGAHHDPKCYSVMGLGSTGDLVVATVGLMDDRLAERLADLPPGHAHRFGDHPGHVGVVVAEPRLVRQSSWEQLAAQGPARRWRLELRTPLCFRRGSVPSPWPDPHRVVNSLVDRWTLGSGEAPPFPVPDSRNVLVTHVDLETFDADGTPQNSRRRSEGANGPQIVGAVGEVEWQWLPDRRFGDDIHGAAALNALLALCNFTGVGSYPQFGMGRVDVSVLRPGRPPK